MKTKALVLAIALIAANISHATSLPNLTPYQPSGWSDKIVVTRTSGSTTDSTGLTTADSLYMDWAVINNGATATTNGFYTDLYIDGVHTARFNTPGTLSVGSYASVTAYPIGSFSAGTHTIEIIADSTGLVAESNESDNSYTKTITVGNPPLPNLTPYQPSGWSDKIVVTRTSGSTTDSTGLTSADTLYMDWAVINNGTAATTSGFYSALYIDGVKTATFNTAGTLGVNADATVTGYLLGSFTAGTHTIEITVDSTGLVAESNESDNSYTKTITVGNPPLPNLTPYQPSGWSDKIVVTRTSGSTTDSTGLTSADTLYMDWAVINNGTAATTSGFYSALYIDGVKTATFNTAGTLGVNADATVTGYSLGSFSAGTHTIEIVADSTGLIAESNESDNSYTKTITVGTPPLPNLTPYQPSGWSDKIVVTRTSGSTTDSTSLTTADTLYMDWAVINNGTAATTSGFYTALYIDGTQTATFNTAGTLGVNADATVTGYPLGSFTAGTHTIEITVDSTGLIAESNESDNSYTKTITIGSSNTVTLFAASVNGLQATINGVVNNFPTNLVWNWGDGQQTAGFFPESHTYSSAGTYTVQVTAQYSNGSTTSSSENVTVMNPPSVSATLSTLTATPSSAPADGSSQIAATVTLRDINGNPVTGKSVQFYATEINSSGSQVQGSLSFQGVVNPTDANGQATATLTANTPGTVTITVKDTTDNVAVQQPATAIYTVLTSVTPNSDLASAISDFDIASQSNLGALSTLTGELGTSGDYFREQAQESGVDVASDIAFSAVDASGIIPNNIGNLITETYVENTAPTVINGGLEVIDELKASGNNDCNANNLFDSGWLNAMANNSLSSQAAAQGMLDHSQKIMAAMWLQKQGQSVSIGSLSDGAVSSALASLYNSSDGLTEVASALPGCLSSTLDQDLTTRKTTLLNGIPPLSAAQQTAWANDLAARQGVPLAYDNIILQYQQFLATMANLNESAKFGEDAAMVLQTFAGVFALIFVDPESGGQGSDFVDAVDGAVNTFADNSRLNTFEQMYSTAFTTMEQGFDYSGRIWLNEAGSFGAIEKGQLPQTVTATIGTPVHYSIGYLGGILNLVSQVEQKSYTEIPIQNTSSASAVFEICALYTHKGDFFPGLGWPDLPLIAITTATLDPGESQSLRVYYTQEQQRPASPDAGTTVKIFVLGSNGSGVFSFGEFDTVWAANWLAESDNAIVSKAGAIPQGKTPAIPQPQDDTNSVPTIPNPIAAYWTYSPSNQTYNVQLKISNPFNLPLMAVVTQAIPTNITVLSTDGAFDISNSIISWTNTLLAYTNVSGNFSFNCDAPYGSSFTIPAATLLLEDTNSGATLTATSNVPQFVGLSTVQVSSSTPVGVLGVDSTMLVAVTNLTGASQLGSLTVTLMNLSGNAVTNFSQSFSLNGSGGTNLNFVLPSSLPSGSYTLIGSLNINGGTGQVLAGNYVVPAQPVTLGVDSPAIDSNGLHILLNGPPGSNYLIMATSNLSDPTTRQAILFFSPTNMPFHFTVPMATNASQMFYQAVMQ